MGNSFPRLENKSTGPVFTVLSQLLFLEDTEGFSREDATLNPFEVTFRIKRVCYLACLSSSHLKGGRGYLFEDLFLSQGKPLSTREVPSCNHIADRIHSTRSKNHRKRLERRLRHLFLEQKLRWRKFKELRKQVLEVFVNLVIEHALAYGCEGIAIEELSFKELPEWKAPKMRRYFALWFYSRFEERLRHKALRRRLKVIPVKAFNTSRVCHVCGRRGETKGLYFRCEDCKRIFDRDYNGSVNIGIRALKVSGSKSEPYRGEDTPARSPFPQGTVHLKFRFLLSVLPLSLLLSYLRLVETSYLKHTSLLKYARVDKYG